jgi:AsmA protein
MKILKKSLILFVSLFFLLILILWIFTHTVSPDSLKLILNKQLAELTSQPTQIRGDISWQLFPKPGVKITQIQIGNAQRNTYYSAVLDSLFLNLQITPLIRGKLVFNELKVDGFKIHVNTSKEAPFKKLEDALAVKPSEKFPAKFAIDQLLLTRGSISFITSKRGLTLNNVQFGASQFNLHQGFFPVQMKGYLLSTGPKVNLHTYITFKGRVRLTQQWLTQGLAPDNSIVEGQVSFQDFQMNRFKIAKVNATSILKSNELVLNPLNLTLYHGKSVGDLTLHTSANKIVFNQIATGINSITFFKALFGETPITGTMDFSIHGSTVLGSDWQDQLTGKGNITIKEGALNFIDLNGVLNNFSAKLRAFLHQTNPLTHFKLGNQLESSSPTKGRTPFQLISVEYQLNKNLLLNEFALLQTNTLQMKGEGIINLQNYVINHRGMIKKISGDKTLEVVQNLLQGSIPVQITGTLLNPLIQPDVQKIAPIAAELILNQSLEKPMQRFKSQLNNLLDKASLTTL